MLGSTNQDTTPKNWVPQGAHLYIQRSIANSNYAIYFASTSDDYCNHICISKQCRTFSFYSSRYATPSKSPLKDTSSTSRLGHVKFPVGDIIWQSERHKSSGFQLMVMGKERVLHCNALPLELRDEWAKVLQIFRDLVTGWYFKGWWFTTTHRVLNSDFDIP